MKTVLVGLNLATESQRTEAKRFNERSNNFAALVESTNLETTKEDQRLVVEFSELRDIMAAVAKSANDGRLSPESYIVLANAVLDQAERVFHERLSMVL